jgi:hypothetical protein
MQRDAEIYYYKIIVPGIMPVNDSVTV